MAQDNSQTGPTDVPNAAAQPHETGVPQAAPAAGTPVSAIAPTEQKDLKNDISKILQGVKLPERRQSGLAQQKKNVIEVKSFDTILGADARAEIADKKEAQAAAPETPPQPNPKDPEDDGSVVSMHTFKQDLQHVVRDSNISIVRAASLEQAKMRPGPIEDNFPAPKRSYAGVIVLTLVLLLLGAAAVFGVIFVMSQSSAALPVHTNTSIVFAEQTVSYPVDGKSPSAVKSELAQARAGGSSSLGSITQIVPVIQTGGVDRSGNPAVRPLTLTEFFTSIGATPPADLLRALGDTFFFGIHTVDKNAPVLVIPVTSYDRAFAGMLAWEATLNSDLAPIFTPVSMNTLDASGLPTTRTFTDDVIRNYDVRELKNDSGTVELYYSFPSRRVLVIAESPYTFTEILSRLQANSNL